MDFLDPKKRRAHTRRLYIGYVLVGVAIGLGALILLFASFGYSVDTKGNVFQNGLVFLSSTPESAQVKITNKAGSFSQEVITSDRLELKADTYNFQFLKQGYKPWQHAFDIAGGSIERLVYPFLVPETLKTDVAEEYAIAPGLVTQSPDRQTILVQQADSLTNFQVFESNNLAKAPTTFTIPNNVLPTGSTARSYQLVEWSTNNRHVLLRYDSDTGPVFIVIDRENPERSRNLNAYFGLTPTKLTLRDKNPEKFYITLPDKRLIAAEVENKLTRDIATNVIDFKSHGNNDILYVTTTNAQPNKVLAMVLSDNKAYEVRELPLTDKYILDLAQYRNEWYVVVGASNATEAYIYRDPVLARKQSNNTTATIRTVRLTNPQRVMFSATSRFIAIQEGSNFVVYDAEKDEQYRFTVNPNYDDPNAVRWMDGHRLMGSTGSKVLIIDFDGTNQQTLSPMVPSTQPMFDDNYEQLNTLAPNGTGQALTNTAMRVTQ
jgi:hypothetical protein